MDKLTGLEITRMRASGGMWLTFDEKPKKKVGQVLTTCNFFQTACLVSLT